jgi:hypothetical protein
MSLLLSLQVSLQYRRLDFISFGRLYQPGQARANFHAYAATVAVTMYKGMGYTVPEG